MTFSHDLVSHPDINMDGGTSSMLQSNDMDIDMDGPQGDSHANGHLQNGTVDPRAIFDQVNPIEYQESELDESSSQSSSDRKELPRPRKFALLSTGVCYDDRMRLHANADFSASPHHPEDPRRIEAIMKEFKDAGLVYKGSEEDLAEILRVSPTRFMERIPAREATKAEICTVHSAQHYEWVEKLAEKTSAELREMTTHMDQGRKSLYVGNLTHAAALISAGGAIETCKHVVAGLVKNAIAVIRPPGHHAEPHESMGFCIFNNVPIATKICQLDYPDLCRKVLILDWDVHHGNGIQTMFYDDPNVLYISLHVYQNGSFYPAQPEDGSPDGGMENVGVGRGVGRNVNIPWDDQGMGDGEYLAAFQRIVMPIAQEFEPDLVVVSAGFDAAAGDELGGCFVSPACYSHMTHMLMSLANGKLAVCLEGGYDLRAISKSALAVAKTLMGEPPERISMKDNPLNRKADEVLNKVKRHQAPYWDCMRPGVVDIQSVNEHNSIRLSDVIQLDKRRRLSEKFKMLSLFIQREGLSRSFQNQVLATPQLWSAKKILFIIHDPPDVLAQPDLSNNKVQPENAWTKDVVFPYIEWAVKNGFGVVDVNIPMHNSEPEDEQDFAVRASETKLQLEMKDLLLYLWDNYLSFAPQNCPIILMGVGDSYLGIKQLLLSRPNAINSHIHGVIAFVSESLKPVKSETDPSLSKWYKENSLIYVSPDHAVWCDDDSARRVRRQKYGNVVKSDVQGLSDMLRRYGPDGGAEAVEWIVEKCGEVDGDETEEEEEEVANYEGK